MSNGNATFREVDLGVLSNPCNRTATNRNWTNTRRGLNDLFNNANNHETRITNLEEGDILTSLGGGVVPFEINKVYAPPTAYARVNEIVYSGGTWSPSATHWYIVDISDNGRYKTNFVVGYRGWGRANVDNLEFTGVDGELDLYEIVELEGKARWIQVTLTTAMASNAATGTVNEYWGGYPNLHDPGATVTVNDPLQKWVGAAIGDRNFALWDETRLQYIITSPPPGGVATGVTLHRFVTTADMSLAQATVAATLTPGGAQTIHDSPMQWEGLTGSAGWAALMPDTGQYEILLLEGPARYIEGTTTGGGGASGLSVTTFWGAPMRPQDPGSTVSTKDPGNLFQRSLNGANALAVWEEKDQKYLTIESESQAGEIYWDNSLAIDSSGRTVTVDDFWGTQQDIQDPISTQLVKNPIEAWQDAPIGGQEGIAIFDALDGTHYNMVAGTETALFVHFTLTAELSGSPWTATATIDGFYRGEDPRADVGDPITVTDVLAKWRWKAPSGAKGIAIRAHDGTTGAWHIVELQQYKRDVFFTLQTGGIDKEDKFALADISANQGHIPGTSSHDGEITPSGSIRVYNPGVLNDGPYMFEGVASAEGQARLCESDAAEAVLSYYIVQLECPPDEIG